MNFGIGGIPGSGMLFFVHIGENMWYNTINYTYLYFAKYKMF